MIFTAYFQLARRLLQIALLLWVVVAAQLVATAQGNGYWHTAGAQILNAANQPIRIAGINWYGFETHDQLVHGLENQDYRTILRTIKLSGFNTVRIPFSNQMVEEPIVPPIDKAPGGINSDLVRLNSLEILDRIIQAAGNEGLKVILDNHRSDAGDSNQHSGLWYSGEYPESSWIADWKFLVSRYQNMTDQNGNAIVTGVDLRNEPFRMVDGLPSGSCWTGDTAASGCPESDAAHNWPAAAERAGRAVLGVNPHLLIFVEGVDCYNQSCNWQGGNLQGAGSYPVHLPVAHRLVYSAHDYGPSVSPQPWFNASTTTDQLMSHWSQNWAYLAEQNIAPVCLGEFGTTAADQDAVSSTPGSQGQWFSTLISFLRTEPKMGWAYWAVNSEDANGLFATNYQAPSASLPKMTQLASIQFALVDPTSAQVAASTAESERWPWHLPHPSGGAIAIGAALSLALGALLLAQRSGRQKKEKDKTPE